MSKLDQPWWITEGVLDGSHPHEPIAFIRRRGGGPEDLDDYYEFKFSAAGAKEVLDSGANFVETCFFKGLGLECERPEMERTRRFIRHMHALGLRVGVYTQWGSLFNETFFQEIPEARNWVQIGVDGRPIEYLDLANQYYRWRGCPGNKDFRAFLRRAIDVAIKEYHVDVVYFDNMCLFENHNTLCYCPCCREGFRAFLTSKFPTPEAMFRRLGIRNATHVEPPVSHPWAEHTEIAFPIRDPLLQEFITFRCEQLAAAWHETWQYIQSVSPRVGIMGNPSFPRKYNERLTSAIDFWLLRNTPGMYYMENAVRGGGVREGAVVSNVRGYKYGRALGVTFVPCGHSPLPGLDMGESMAFNNGSGSCGTGWQPLKAFFSAHRDEFYRGVEPAAEVAVLRDDNSLTLRWHEAFTVMELAQQELLCAGVPWMPLWRQQLHDGALEKYRVLVLPGNACVSKEDAAAITRFVEAGGGLVLCENAGTFSEHHLTIARWRFAHLFEAEHGTDGFEPSYAERGLRVSMPKLSRPLAANFGKGRAVCLPQVRGTREPVRSYAEIGGYDGMQHLRLPKNWRALAKAVEQVAPSPLAVTLSGPTTLLAEFLRKGGKLLVHLLNYDAKRVPAGAAVRLNRPATSATLYVPDAPDGGAARALKIARPKKSGAAIVRLPAFARYALLVVE